MIPAIILGNFAFILIYKAVYVNKKVNYIVSAIIAVVLKAAIIYAGFSIMNALMNLPSMVQTTLNTSMGVTQLITATSGSILTLLIMTSVKMCRKKAE